MKSLQWQPLVEQLALLGEVRDVPKQPRDNGEVPISKWSGWQFNARYEIFYLLDEKTLTK